MQRIVTAVLVLVVSGGLSLSQARAESKDTQPGKVQAKDLKSAKVIDKMTSKAELKSAPFSSECRRYYGSYYGNYYYTPYYSCSPYYTYSYSPYYTYRYSYYTTPSYYTYRTYYTY